jgi:sortase A
VRAGLIALCAIGLFQAVSAAIIPAKAVVAQLLLERAFDRSVASHQPERPWPWADMAPAAKLSVERLGVERIVIDTGSGQALAFGPTLLPGAAPIGAQGTAVIAAHRDTHFEFLQQVRAGDVIPVAGIDGVTHRYRVTGSEVVRWDRFAVRPSGAPALALATCYPFGANYHGPLRYVVHAVAVEAQLRRNTT